MKKKVTSKSVIETKVPRMVVGLDIGTTKIVMVMGYLREDGKIEVCGHAKVPSTGVEFGLVLNVTDTIEGIKNVKNLLESATGEEVKDVFVGVAGRHIRSMVINHSILRQQGKEKPVVQEEIDQMAQDIRNCSVEGAIIDVIPQFYSIDGYTTMRPVGMVGQRLTGTYQLIVGNNFEIGKILQCVREAGLQMRELVLEPIASAIACLKEEEKKNGVALIDIGGGTSDLVIYKSSVPVYTKVIPIGGQVITNDILSLGVDFEEAERLKKQHGNCIVERTNPNNFIRVNDNIGLKDELLNERDLARVINARVKEDILSPIFNEVNKSDVRVKNVVLTGGGSLLKDIDKLSEFVMGKRTTIGIPTANFSSTLDSALKDPTYSTALGLLSHGCQVIQEPFCGEAIHIPPADPTDDIEGPENPGTGFGAKAISAIKTGFETFVKNFVFEKGDGIE